MNPGERILLAGSGIKAHQSLNMLLKYLEQTLLLRGDTVGEGLLRPPENARRYDLLPVESLAQQVLLAPLLGWLALGGRCGEVVGREEVVEEGDAQLEAVGGCGAVGAAHVVHVEVVAEAERFGVALLGRRLLVEVHVALAELVGAFAREQNHCVRVLPANGSRNFC